MNLSDQISALHQNYGRSVPTSFWTTFCWGFFSFLSAHNWLWVEDSGTYWTVYIASGKTTHCALFGPCYGIDVDKTTGALYAKDGLTGAWKTALSMWPIRNKEKAETTYKYLASKIEKAYRRIPADVS